MSEVVARPVGREPKQRRSRLRERRILEVAWELFCAPGASEVSVREVCAAAETSPSSFYARFRDRSGLLVTIVERFEREFLETIEAAIVAPHVRGDLPAFVHHLVTTTLELASRRAPLVGRARRAAVEDPAIDACWKRFEERCFAALEGSVDRVEPGPRANAIIRRHRQLSPAIEAIYRGVDGSATAPPYDEADAAARRAQLARDLTEWLLAEDAPATSTHPDAERRSSA